ncbi:MAG: DUF2891 domain-containing protein [Raineya sp.]
MIRPVVSLLFFCFLSGVFAQKLNSQQAEKLAALPLKCLQQEYPNKLNQVLSEEKDLGSPKELHPAFYGCFDWHSSVHGHWTLVYLLKHFPDLPQKDLIIRKLINNLSQENIHKEIAYFQKKQEYAFERMYGWAWLLQLQQELQTHPQEQIQALAENLQPLTNLLISRYQEFLPKLLYPVRVGTHTNTAFGMNLAWDYAVATQNITFQNVLRKEAIRLFGKDLQCPFAWEPSGTDFLSPCMEELTLMMRVLSKKDFLVWVKKFAPQLLKKKFSWEVAKVSDRQDGHLVHLDGLNFSRAWNFYHLAKTYPEFAHLKKIADTHLSFSLSAITDGNYEGEHWLASFALRALMTRE